jgi:hypothetical protein
MGSDHNLPNYQKFEVIGESLMMIFWSLGIL